VPFVSKPDRTIVSLPSALSSSSGLALMVKTAEVIVSVIELRSKLAALVLLVDESSKPTTVAVTLSKCACKPAEIFVSSAPLETSNVSLTPEVNVRLASPLPLPLPELLELLELLELELDDVLPPSPNADDVIDPMLTFT
jgi:hypothetical protein